MIIRQIQTLFRNLSSYFLPGSPPAPANLRSNFRNLYFDVSWFGVTTGSVLSFITVYAARLGANTTQIGLINAMPAIVTLFVALPAGSWLNQRPINKSVFLTAICQRIFYLFMAVIPWFFTKDEQIWLIIAFTLVMSIPGSVISIGFNVLFASSVPMRYRSMVAARRNAFSALVTVVTALLCGRILTVLPFQFGYQVVFGLGFLGGLMSAIHLWRVKPVADYDEPNLLDPLAETIDAEEGSPESAKAGGIFAEFRRRLNLDALTGPFGKSLLLLTIFHFVHYLSIPIFPVFYVNNIGLSDQVISNGTAIFYMTMFLGSSQISRMVIKTGNTKATGIGIMLLGLYPVLLSFAKDAVLFYAASFFGGYAWSVVNVSMINYLLEKVPAQRRTGYLAWFSLGINAAVLGGTMLGPVIGNWISLSVALFIFGLLRTLSGVAVLKWGK